MEGDDSPNPRLYDRKKVSAMSACSLSLMPAMSAATEAVE
jgi:hypothetical protein